jgi:hypothetical protein
VQVFGGIVSDDHNQELRGSRAIETADKMRRSGVVRSIEKVISLPIRGTTWLVEEPDKPSAAEKEAAELLRSNLFGGMRGSFDDLLREACLAVYYGFRIPEILWEEREGALAIEHIASRNPKLVERWLYDERGRLVGFVYNGSKPTGAGLTEQGFSGSQSARVAVPLEKTVHFVYDQENENPQGLGLWRSMYPHWYMSDATARIMAIGIERSLLGVPYAEQGEGADANQQNAMLGILSRLRAAEDAAAVIPQGWKLGWFESQRSPMDALQFVQHQDARIAQVALAQYLLLGQGKAGTQALATELVKVFQDAEEATAGWIEATLQQQLVKRWCLYCYGEGVRPPLLRHRRIGARSLDALAAVLQQLTTGGWAHPTVEDEEYLRDLMELPAIPREQLLKAEQERQAQAQQEREAQQKPRPKGDGQDGMSTSPLRDVLSLAPSMMLASSLSDPEGRHREETSFAASAKRHLEAIQSAYLAALKPHVDAAEGADPVGAAGPIHQMMQVDVPGGAEYTVLVRGWLSQVLQQGRTSIERETKQPAPAPVTPRLNAWVTARAQAIAAHHLEQLRTDVLNRVLTGVRAGMAASRILSDAGATGSEELAAAVQQDWNAAGQEIAEQLARE